MLKELRAEGCKTPILHLTAKAEVEKPFDKEEELTEKTNRLNVLNGLLNVDKRENELVDGAPDEGDSVPVSKERAYER